MSPYRYVWASVLLLAASPATAQTSSSQTAKASDAAVDSSAGSLEFSLSEDVLPSSKIQLVNGYSVNVTASLWHTVVMTPLLLPNGVVKPKEGRCTGSLIGSGVILLAAHCLDTGGPLGTDRPAYFKVDSERVKLSCSVLPIYLEKPGANAAPRRSEDIALCHAAFLQPHPSLDSMQYEMLDAAPLGSGSAVLMTGYGCTDLGKQTEMDTTLRIGDSKIGRAASGSGTEADYAWITSTRTQPTLCPGDSGGPLFTGATTQQQDAPRRVRGVNSSVQDSALFGYISRVAMLSEPTFVAWAKDWLKSFPGAYICGISDADPGQSCQI